MTTQPLEGDPEEPELDPRATDAVPLPRPPPGWALAIPAEAGQVYLVEFDPKLSLLKVEGADLHFIFADGGKLVLQDFAGALSGTIILTPDGAIPAFELFQLAELTSEDPQSLQVLAEKILTGSGNNNYSDDTGATVGGLEGQGVIDPRETETEFALLLGDPEVEAQPTDVTVQVDDPGIFIEDTAGNLVYLASATSTDELTKIQIKGLAGWRVVEGELERLAELNGIASVTFNERTGTLTILFDPDGEKSFTSFENTIAIIPPADSDIDRDGVTITAVARDKIDPKLLAVMTSPIPTLIVDAVADPPIFAGPTTATAGENSTFRLPGIEALVTDEDGSESVVSFEIGQIPVGARLSDGTNSFTASAESTSVEVVDWDLSQLTITPPTDFDGSFTLTLTAVTSEKNTNSDPALGDQEVDLSNNQATSEAVIEITIEPLALAPEVALTVTGAGLFKEDRANDVAIEAAVSDQTDQLVSIVIDGLTWGVSGAELAELEAHVDVADASFAGDSLTIVFEPGTESFFYDTLTLTPSEDTDLDLSGLEITGTAADKSDELATKSTTVMTDLIVDAVADAGSFVETSGIGISTDGSIVDLNLTLTPRDGANGTPDDDPHFNPGGVDDDGSEAVTEVTVTLSGDGIDTDSDVAFLFDLAGLDSIVVAHAAGSLVWNFSGSEADLQALVATFQIDPQDDYSGTINVAVEVLSEEGAAGGEEPDPGDNQVTESFDFSVTAVQSIPPPVVEVTLNQPDDSISEDSLLADNVVTVTAMVSGDEFLQTIVITGLPTDDWSFDFSGLVQAGVAEVDESVAGQVTIVFAPGAAETYSGSFQLAPPPDSDVDLGTLTVTATATALATASQAEAADAAAGSDSLDIFLDAAVDGSEMVQPDEVMGEINTTIDLELSIDLGGDSTTGPGESQGGTDSDGSEGITEIIVTLSAGDLGFVLPGSVAAPLVSPDGTWTFDTSAASLAEVQSLVDSLTVTPPLDFEGVIEINVTTTTEEAASIADGGSAGPDDVETDESDNLDVDSYVFFVEVGRVALAPDVSLTVNGDGVFKEDLPNSLTIQAAVVDSTDQLTMLEITGLDWGVDPAQLALLEAEAEVAVADFSGDTLTILFEPGVESFDYAALELTPPEDSDVDLAGVEITASVEDKSENSLTNSASEAVTLELDAVLDETGAVTQLDAPEVDESTDGSQTVGLDLDFELVGAGFPGSLVGGPDTDGSESVTAVAVFLSDGLLTLDPAYSGGVVLMDEGGGNWSLSGWADMADLEAAIEALSVEIAENFNGTITGSVSVSAAEANTPEGEVPASGAEADVTDNERQDEFPFSVTVNALAQAPTASLTVNGDGFFKEDAANDVTIEAAVDNPSDQLTALVISGLTWGVSADELAELAAHTDVATADFAGDSLTITFEAGVESFSYTTLTLTPPADSDQDLGGVEITATVADKNDPSATAAAGAIVDLVVDAVLDETALVVQIEEPLAPPDGEDQTVSLNLDFSLIDAGFAGSLDGGEDGDGSEAVTAVEILVSDGVLLFDGTEPDGVALSFDDDSGRWLLTGYADTAELEQAIEALAVEIPGDFAGASVTGTIFVTTQERNTPPDSTAPDSGLEPEGGDNVRIDAFDFAVITADPNEIDISLVTNTNTRDQVALFTFAQTGEEGEAFFWTVIGLKAEGQEESFALDAGFAIEVGAPADVTLEWLSGEQILVDEFAVEFADIDAELSQISKIRIGEGQGAVGNQIEATIEPGTADTAGSVDPEATETNFGKLLDDGADGLLQVAGDDGGNDLLVWDPIEHPDVTIVGGDGIDSLRILGGGNEIVVAELIAEHGGAIGIEIFDLTVDLPKEDVTDNGLVLSNEDFGNLGLVAGISQIAVLGDGGDSLTLADLTDGDGQTWQLAEGDAPGFATYVYADTGSGDNIAAKVLVQIGDPDPLVTDDDIAVVLSNMG